MRTSFGLGRAALAVAVLALAAVPLAASAIPPSPDWFRTWVADPPNGGLIRLVISESPRGPVAEAWGECHPADCAWGTVKLTVSPNGFDAGAIYTSSFDINHLSMRLSPNHRTLHVVERVHFIDGSGRPDYSKEVRLR
jgi:hypothetical protein